MNYEEWKYGVSSVGFKTRWHWANLWGLLWFFPLIALFVSAVWAFVGAVAVSLVFHIRRLFRKKSAIDKRLNSYSDASPEEDFVFGVQQDLDVDFAKFNYKPTNSRHAMGGFMIPFLPFFSKVISRNGFKEATIHEHVHIWWMVYGFQTAFAYFLMIFATGWWKYLVIFGWLILQEYLTFTKTHNYARTLGIETRLFNSQIFYKYLMFYSSFILSIVVLKQMTFLPLSVYVLILIIVIYGLSKMWYLIWHRMGWIKDQKMLEG